ncbi:MAG: rhamnose transport system substrate-binding protein [Pirellulaceae bacterium]|jgi:rhamnose transport system substrate-binding protein
MNRSCRFLNLLPLSFALNLLLVLSLLVLSVGCDPQKDGENAESQGSGADRELTICLLPKIKGIPYFTSCANGAREAADELVDVKLIYDGPTDGDARKQAEMIENWTVLGVDAICVAPNTPDVVATAMKQAGKEGIQIITWDADGTKDSRSHFVNQATAAAIGLAMVEAMVKDVGGPDVKGDVVIISSDSTSDNQNSWIEIMKPALAKTNLNLATIKYPGENAGKALADAKDVIKKYPELKGIFGISSVAFPAAAEAVQQMNKTGEIQVTGLSLPSEMKKYVKSGTVKSVILWNTIDLGYATVYAARALVKGTLSGEALPAGRLGELQVVDDNVMLGDVMIFTAENIDDYDF